MSLEDRKSRLSLARIYNCLGSTHATEIIENILKHEIDINYKVPAQSGWCLSKSELLGATALHLAAVKKDAKSFKLLLDCGADFTIKDDKGFTALHCVIQKLYENSEDYWDTIADNDFINLTISAHVQFENFCNPCNTDGLSHFHIACMTNNSEAVDLFLKNGVAVDDAVSLKSAKFAGWTPLHFAARSYSSGSLKVILSNNANRCLKNLSDMTPSDLLVQRRIELLSSQTIASERNYNAEKVKADNEKIEEILRLLISFNIEKNVLAVDKTIFHAICSMQDSSVCTSFEDCLPSSDYSVANTCRAWEGLYFAAFCNFETVKLLLSKNFSMSIRNTNVTTPLNIFISNRHVEEVHAVLNLVPKWEDIVFSQGDARLSDIILTMRDPDEFNDFLRNTLMNVNLPIIKKSPLCQGYTSLHLAVLFSERFKAEDNPLILVELCLKQGADVTFQDAQGQTPIHLAYFQNKMKVVELLLNHQFTMKNPVDKNGLSHLHIACVVKNVRLVRDLVDYVDVNIVYRNSKVNPEKPIKFGYMPLHVAVANGCSEIVEVLIKGGADVNARDGNGLTPIHQVLLSSEARKIGNILLSIPNLEDREVSKMRLSHLHIACFVDNVDAVNKLLDLGADINASIAYDQGEIDSNLKTLLKPYSNFTPLDIAVKKKSSKTVELLLQRNADILVKKPSKMILLIDILTRKDNKQYKDLFLSKFWADKDLQKRLETEAGISMLHIACHTFNLGIIADLLKTEIDVNMQVPAVEYDWAGRTPLHLFLYKASVDSMQNFEETLKMLLDKGASVTITDVDGSTPIHHYVYYGFDREHTRLLLNHHRDFTLNPTDKEGVSHFHFACFANHVEVVKQFIESGSINVNQPVDAFFDGEGSGLTTLDLAVSPRTRRLHGIQSQLETIDLLLKHKTNPRSEDVLGMTPLHTIAADGPSRLELLEKFVEHGAYGNYQNASGDTPFEALLKSSDVSVQEIDFFLKHGCQVNCFNPVRGEGYMSMLISKKYHNREQNVAFDEIISASDGFLRNEAGRTVIHNIVACTEALISVDRYIELIDKFTKLGVDVDDQDESGKTALHIAAYFGNSKATDALLRTGSDVNIVDEDGKVAFAYAVKSKVKSTSRETMIKSLANHVYKLQFLKLDLSQLNENLLKDNEPNVDPSFIEELNECYLVKRHSLDLGGFLSETGTVANYCFMLPFERAKVDQFFESFHKDDNLMQLKDVLRLQYRKAVARLRLSEPSVQTLGYSVRWQLPDVPRRAIVRCLSNSNLKDLIATAPDQSDDMMMDVD